MVEHGHAPGNGISHDNRSAVDEISADIEIIIDDITCSRDKAGRYNQYQKIKPSQPE